ncbi:hypothetical protein H0X06_01460 [Candidatus Dependentiae bacterium]|nr:hypothetical protein [Candidatus Dependentiae bacterium]
MKSIMEEASSIMKAIEKGWINAGQPKEFTIKVFEEVQKNFIGMTIRPAKIGIFFTEHQPQPEPTTTPKKTVTAPAPKRVEVVKPAPVKEQQTPAKQPVLKTSEPIIEKAVETEPRQLGPVWNDDMVASVKQWLPEIFDLIGLAPLSFTIQPDHFLLKIHFEKDVYDDKTREKYLFSSLSTLIVTMLKRQYKRPLKGYKIVLVGA